MKKIISISREVIDYLENGNWLLSRVIIIFFFIIAIRDYLEQFSNPFNYSAWQSLHSFFFYCSVALFTVIWLQYMTQVRIVLVARALLPTFLILTVAPFVDLLMTWGVGSHMAYLHITDMGDFIRRYFMFMGFDMKMGVTIGIHLGVAMVLSGAFYYSWLKGLSIIKSLLVSLGLYTFMYLNFAMGFIYENTTVVLGISSKYSDRRFAYIYATLSLLLLLKVLYVSNRPFAVSVIRKIFSLRLVHYLAFFVLGMSVGLSVLDINDKWLTDKLALNVFFVVISVVSAWSFSIASARLAEIEINGHEQKNTEDGTSLKTNYQIMSYLSIGCSLLFALFADFVVYKLVFAFMGFYYLYFMPPLRFKRLFLVSSILMAANAMVVAIMGFVLVGGKMSEFPASLIWFILIGVGLCINFIDLKNYAGDKAAGIKTLPVVIGMKWAQLIISIFFVAANVWAYFLFALPAWTIIFVILTSVAEIYFINKKEYRERPVFLTYLAGLIFLLSAYMLS